MSKIIWIFIEFGLGLLYYIITLSILSFLNRGKRYFNVSISLFSTLGMLVILTIFSGDFIIHLTNAAGVGVAWFWFASKLEKTVSVNAHRVFMIVRESMENITDLVEQMESYEAKQYFLFETWVYLLFTIDWCLGILTNNDQYARSKVYFEFHKHCMEMFGSYFNLDDASCGKAIDIRMKIFGHLVVETYEPEVADDYIAKSILNQILNGVRNKTLFFEGLTSIENIEASTENKYTELIYALDQVVNTAITIIEEELEKNDYRMNKAMLWKDILK